MKILCLINFGDRKHCNRRTLGALKERLRRSGHAHAIRLSRSLDEARRIIGQARERGFDTLLVGGGDGTIHHTLNMTRGQGWTMGVLPMGTTNALARSLGVPLDPVRSLEAALGGQARTLDVGEIGGRLFICFASIGWDAEVVHKFVGEAKVKYGRAGYVVAGVSALRRLGQLPMMRLESPSLAGPVEARQVIISNIANYAGLNLFSNDMGDGRMDVLACRGERPGAMLRYAGQMVLHPRRSEMVRLFPGEVVKAGVEEMTLCADERMFLQLDGDPVELENNFEYRLKVRREEQKFLIT